MPCTRTETCIEAILAYLGGNGFYWKVVRHTEQDDLLEIRRAEGGIRAWAAEPGEYYIGFDGTYGGLWRRCGQPPQHLVGVGFTAQGTFTSLPYQRVPLPSSVSKSLAWLFQGIPHDEQILGDFGYSGHGAAGFELDRVDPRELERQYASSSSHPDHDSHDENEEGHIVIVAHSIQDTGDPPKFVLVPEEVLTHITILSGGTTIQAKRADMVYWKPTATSGQVFSTGSICFYGSLPWNKFDNSISTCTLLSSVTDMCVCSGRESCCCALCPSCSHTSTLMHLIFESFLVLFVVVVVINKK